jgi:hypothetical protein
MFTELLPSNDRMIHRLSCDKTWTIYKIMPPTILLLLHVFIAIGKVFTKLLNSNNWEDTDTETDRRDL